MFGRAHGRAAALAVIEEAIEELGADAVHMAVMTASSLFTAHNGGVMMSREEAEDVIRELVSRIDHAGFSADAGRVQNALETLLEPVVPPLMGASEAAEILGMANTNLKKLRPPLVPVAQFKSGPVYLASDVMAARARRERRS